MIGTILSVALSLSSSFSSCQGSAATLHLDNCSTHDLCAAVGHNWHPNSNFAINGLRNVTPVRHALVSSSSASWTPIGPNPIVNSIYGGNVSGRITGIAISSGSPSKIFAASAGGGVWASDNSGVSWATSTDSQPDIAMGAVSVDPMNSQVVFAGTGEDNFCGDCHPGAGVLESVDGGKSWTDSNPNDVFTGQTIGSIIFEPGARLLSRTTVLVAASGGLYVSHDGGVSWNIESGSGWQNGHVTSVVINALTPQVAIYAWVCGVGLEASPDNGNTWEVIDTTGASESLGRGSLAIIPSGLSSQITLYDSIGSDAGYIGMMKSTDGGVTWNLLDSCTDPLQTNCIPTSQVTTTHIPGSSTVVEEIRARTTMS